MIAAACAVAEGACVRLIPASFRAKIQLGLCSRLNLNESSFATENMAHCARTCIALRIELTHLTDHLNWARLRLRM